MQAAYSQDYQGLTSHEASARLKHFGANVLRSKSRISVFGLFLRQFLNPLVFILLIASGVAFGVGLTKDAYLILGIIVMNAILGFWQEYKAEKALQSLRNTTISSTRVIRDNVEQKIENKYLVPGDLVILSEGRKVPADCYLLPENSIEVNESALTGESLPVRKTGGDEEASMSYMGTIVTSGIARAVIIRTGMSTRLGSIAAALKEVKDEPTPFQKSMDKLAKVLAVLAVFAAGIVFLAGLFSGNEPLEMFLVSASLAVAAVPEGLPAIVGLALALGAQRMAKKKAIMRKMAATEALGAVTVICTDKTGTITTGDMRIRKIWHSGKLIPASQLGSGNIPKVLLILLKIGVYANASTLVLQKDKQQHAVLGDPTDGALLLLAQDLNILSDLQNTGEIIEEFTFDDDLKLISAIHSVEKNTFGYVRGAPEKVLELSRSWQNGDSVETMTDELRNKLRTEYEQEAEKGFRMIGFGYRKLEQENAKHLKRSDIEKDLIYVGFVAIADPPRPEVKQSLNKAKSAGVKTIMLTGDNILTAKAIAEEVGMLDKGDEIILGDQLDDLTDQEVDKLLLKVRIVARATPEQKLRVVQSLQRNNETVAVTGDGINDSLALKQADVGVAMGIRGTDVAKGAADIVLADDQYSTIVSAIEEGRRIDDNLKKAVRFLIAGNFSEILTVFAAVIAGFATPLLPIHILWINIVTDGLPAFALAADQGSDGRMRKKPSVFKEHPLNKKGLIMVATAGLITSAAALIGFFVFLPQGIEIARTAAFTILVFAQMILAFIIDYVHRGNMFSFKESKWLILAVLGTLALQIALLSIPVLRNTFHLVLPF